MASIAYVVGDAAFIHDTLFMPDGGTARANFPGGSAKALWPSIQRIIALPDDTRLLTGHDYQPGGREPQWESTVGQQQHENRHLMKTKTEEEFRTLREARYRELPMHKLILHARGGRLPAHKAELAGGKRLVLYCGSGSRLALAAQALTVDGHRERGAVAGGFAALQQAGASIEEARWPH